MIKIHYSFSLGGNICKCKVKTTGWYWSKYYSGILFQTCFVQHTAKIKINSLGIFISDFFWIDLTWNLKKDFFFSALNHLTCMVHVQPAPAESTKICWCVSGQLLYDHVMYIQAVVGPSRAGFKDPADKLHVTNVCNISKGVLKIKCLIWSIYFHLLCVLHGRGFDAVSPSRTSSWKMKFGIKPSD